MTEAPPLGIKIGYARVSTDDQDLALQRDAMEKEGVTRVFEEKASGAKADRPQLKDCLGYLRQGDTFVVWRLDRLGRNARMLMETLDFLRDNGIHFQSLTENVDTSTATGELVFNIFAVFAQFELALIKERTKAGLAAANKRGKFGGAPKKHKEPKIRKAIELKKDHTHKEVCELLSITSSTLHREIKLLRIKDADKAEKRRDREQRKAA